LKHLNKSAGEGAQAASNSKKPALGNPLSDRRYANLAAGKKVPISPQSIERVSWSASKVFFNLPRQTFKSLCNR
jgi:hypothetical protein